MTRRAGSGAARARLRSRRRGRSRRICAAARDTRGARNSGFGSVGGDASARSIRHDNRHGRVTSVRACHGCQPFPAAAIARAG
ncbi:hypothetical protein WS72_25150 [Burkholderia savannae]|uniref:Uncharacterized protein n=1 Tax=Burkholderia savannae TaxID=1637837 RepID=A0ABR5T4M2_9BURK|nr:hypothetical protein WS72_25150 [Burkholderia savannae]